MAIVDQYPTPPPKPKTDPIDIHRENDTAVVDTDVERLDSLLTHVEGMSWIVTYYQQVLGEHDQTASQEVSLDPVSQQYRRIDQLEMKVQSPLDLSVNDETYAQMLRGSSVIYPGTLIPNKGDVFLADIGAGELGVFTLTEIELLSHYKDRCYEVSYRLTRRIDGPKDPYLTDLDHKTVERYTYLKDYLTYGRDPVVTDREVTQTQDIRAALTTLLTHYFNVFYSDDQGTFLMPDTARITYDPQIPKVLMRVFNVTDHPLLRRLRTINTEAVEDTQQMTIWDVLLRRAPELLPTVPKRATLHPAEEYGNNPMLYNVAYSGIDYLVVPERVFSMNTAHDTPHEYLHAYLPTIETRYRDLSQSIPVGEGSNLTLPDTPKVKTLDTYVLSDGVYTLSTVNTKLETEVIAYLRQSGLDRERLVELSQSALRWPYLESYYHIPVLLILLTAAVRGG